MRKVHTLNLKGRILTLDKPMVMGIINTTPDSFYENSRNTDISAVLEKAALMINDGADILDIGGLSTRPGAAEITIAAECERVVLPIKMIKEKFPDSILSIDTYRSAVAKAAVDAGADIVNDISAGDFDDNMIATVAALKVPFVAMHTKGKPQAMQINPQYDNVSIEVYDYLAHKLQQLLQAGIVDVIIDPGFGFGKTLEHNYALLHNLHTLKQLDVPLLVGFSRKSMIYKLLHNSAAEALNGTTVLNTLALQQGADILRVHDVKEAVECVRLLQYYESNHLKKD